MPLLNADPHGIGEGKSGDVVGESKLQNEVDRDLRICSTAIHQGAAARTASVIQTNCSSPLLQTNAHSVRNISCTKSEAILIVEAIKVVCQS